MSQAMPPSLTRDASQEPNKMKISQFACLMLFAAALSACSQKFAVSINDNSVYDPRPNQTSVRFSDAGLQGCVNRTAQQRNLKVEDIKVMACPEWQIEQIESIGALKSLEFLDLQSNRIASLAPLTSLRNLRSISISNNRIRDITPLLRMATLTSATLNGNPNIPCQQIAQLRERLKNNLVADSCAP